MKSLSTKDTVFVIHFHPTVQCSCCINVGNFSRKSLKRFYPKPYQEGHIVFKECNIDEDSLTVKRYGIFSSALGFKRIFQGKEKFREIESVWEFCEDEDKFLPNFKTELDQFLREDKEGEDSTTTKNKRTIP
ncbi:MAG: nitrophenyl compound nitroreductase subunit ArsF family protein [Candidatus Zixiibacteriota bacterium]